MDPIICYKHKVDYIKTSTNEIQKNIENNVFKEANYHDVSVAIASAVTSYSRIYI